MANKLMLLGAGVSGTGSAAGQVSIAANDSAAAEDGSDAGQFTVTLSVVSGTDTVIAYSITGTATGTTDYTALSGTVTIIASATTATIDVSGIIDDAIVEANETVIVTLDSISSGDSEITIDGSANAATVTITDDDVATVSIIANDSAAAEDGSDPGQFTVTQTAASSTNTVIAYSITGDATPTTDYTALTGSVTIIAGATTATIDVSGIIDDVFVEANETVTVSLDSISSGDSHVTVNGAANVATVIITDDDVATVSIIATDATAAEDGSDPGQFTVTQTQVSSTDTVIAYSITGTATATTDYTALSGTVTIAAGVTTAFINVSGIIDDAIVEGDETVIVTLDSISSGDSHVTINGSANVATVTITDDESSITVTAPDGSESWALDSTESITWSDVNLSGNVKIELYKDGSLESVLSADEANDSTYSWAISDSLTAAADYKIRITSLVDGTVYDESDANFTLASAASITVDVPNGGEDWIAGVEQTVEWSSTGITGNVNIKLYDDGEITLVWVWDTANDGEFSFTPDLLRISDDMQIRIESTDDNTIYDYSDADFTIALPPSITVLTPDGGELWESDTTESITWSSNAVTGNVKIELYKDGSLDSTLTSDTANTGSYSWAISAGLADGSDYKIRITSLVDGTVYDESDANFDILSIVTDDLLLYFDAGHSSSYPGSGTTLTDLKGSNNGTLTNGPTYSSDYGGTLVFDGSDDYVAFDLPDEFDGITLNNFDCTQEAWCRFSGSIIPYGSVVCFDSYDLQIMPKDADNIGVWVSDATLTLGAAIEADVWYHFALTKSGNTYALYVDGVSVGSVTDADNLTIGSVGQIGFNGASSYLEGQIPIMRLYDQALTAEEVEQNFDAEKGRFAESYSPPAVTSGLVVKLDVADPNSWDSGASTKWINTVDDEEGDFTNGPAFDDTDSIVSIQYDGSDDFFKLVRDNSDLDSGWTINLWYNPQEYGAGGGSKAHMFCFGESTTAYTGEDLYLFHVTWGTPTGEIGVLGHGMANQRWTGGGTGNVVVDEWCMLTFVNQNTGQMDLFVNNYKNGNPPYGTIIDTAPSDDIWLAVVGGWTSENYYAPVESRIAQVLVYDRPLSDAEVEDLWDGDKERFGLS